MEKDQKSQNNRQECKPQYEPPEYTKHEPVKIVQGSGGSCGGLYYTTLYRTYYY